MGRGWASLRGRAAAGRTRPPSPDDLEPAMGYRRKGSTTACLPPGVLQVVIEGADLPAPAALFQAQQLRPCYVVECGGQSTRVCAAAVGATLGGAVWRGAPKFALAGGCAELRISVKDDVTGAVLGEAVVDTSRVRMNGEDEAAAKLKTPRGKTKGMLRFRLRFIPDAAAPSFMSPDDGAVLSSSIGTSSGASGSLPPHDGSGSASSYPPSISSSNCGGGDDSPSSPAPSPPAPSPPAPSPGRGFGLRSLFGNGRAAGARAAAALPPGGVSPAGPTSDDLELHTIAMAAMHELHAQVHEIAGERAADGASGPLPDSGPSPASRTGSLRRAAARARALLRVARFSGGSSGSASPAADAQAAARAWPSSDVSSDSAVLSQMTAMAEEIEMLHESKAALHKELASLKQAMATLTRQYWAELKSVRDAGGSLAARASLPPPCQATLAPLAPLALPAVAATAVVLSPLRPLGRPRDLERRARLSSSSEGSEEERLALSAAGGPPGSEAALRWYDPPASSRGGPPSVRSVEWFDPERFSARSGQTPSVRSIEWFDPERASLPGTLSPPATEWCDSERMSQVSGQTPSEVPPSQYSGRGPSEAPLSVARA